jgi:hypothetical protein
MKTLEKDETGLSLSEGCHHVNDKTLHSVFSLHEYKYGTRYPQYSNIGAARLHVLAEGFLFLAIF